MATSTAPATDTAPRIVGLLPDGMTEAMAGKVAAEVGRAFRETDGSAVRAVRILPSSVVDRGSLLEFVANTTVEPRRSRPEAPAGWSKVIDSVVTVDLSSGAVKGIRIPFLEREPA